MGIHDGAGDEPYLAFVADVGDERESALKLAHLGGLPWDPGAVEPEERKSLERPKVESVVMRVYRAAYGQRGVPTSKIADSDEAMYIAP